MHAKIIIHHQHYYKDHRLQVTEQITADQGMSTLCLDDFTCGSQ
jgi:hypothetical protein